MRYVRQTRRFLLHTILHADDTPHRIALGVAIAMLVGFLPLIGVQTLLAIGLAALLRANKAVCIPVVWVTNPLTFIPIWGACLSLGRLVMPTTADGVPTERLMHLADLRINLLDYVFWQDLFHLAVNMGKDLWIGCFIAGSAFALLSYGLTRWGVSTYRQRRRERVLRRTARRNRIRSRQRAGNKAGQVA